jgi:hypothetical protein
MEEDLSKLTDTEIEGMISDLENLYAELLGGDASYEELDDVRKKILTLQQEIINRKK